MSVMLCKKQYVSDASGHQSSENPDCSSVTEVPSLTLFTAPSAIPFVSGLCGVHVSWEISNSLSAAAISPLLSE